MHAIIVLFPPARTGLILFKKHWYDVRKSTNKDILILSALLYA